MFSLIEQRRTDQKWKGIYTLAKIVHRPDDVYKMITFPGKDIRELGDDNEVKENVGDC
jgi:hypothetical protein